MLFKEIIDAYRSTDEELIRLSLKMLKEHQIQLYKNVT
jgi:hypothetical protein